MPDLDSLYDMEDLDDSNPVDLTSQYDFDEDEDGEVLADIVYDLGINEHDFLKIWKKKKSKKRTKKPKTAKAKLKAIREKTPEGDMPLERRGELLLRSLFENGAVIGGSDRGASRVYATGSSAIVYLNKFANYGSLRNVVVANTQGASVKQFADGLKVAAVALTVTNSQSGWGYVIKVSTPFQSARNQGVNLSIVLGGVGTTITVRLDPVARKGELICMMEFVVLSVANNGGIGQPANATSCAVTMADGQAGVVDGATSLSVESLNARDLGVSNAVSCQN